jgi:predicted phosphodiesterase
MGKRKLLVINDLHIPYHDKRAVKLILYIINALRPNALVINGDLVDFYPLSAHVSTAQFDPSTLDDELDTAIEFLHEVSKSVGEIVYILGNHEDRLDRFIEHNAKPFRNLLTMENLLKQEDFSCDLEILPYNSAYNVPNTDLYIQHSPPSYGVTGSMTSLKKKLDATHIFGCTHRVQHSCLTGKSGRYYSCYFNGWIGDRDNRVFSYAKGHDNWQQSIIMVTQAGEYYNVEQSVIKDYYITIDGQTFVG